MSRKGATSQALPRERARLLSGQNWITWTFLAARESGERHAPQCAQHPPEQNQHPTCKQEQIWRDWLAVQAERKGFYLVLRTVRVSSIFKQSNSTIARMFSKDHSGSFRHDSAEHFFFQSLLYQNFLWEFHESFRFSPWGTGERWEKLYTGTEFSKPSQGGSQTFWSSQMSGKNTWQRGWIGGCGHQRQKDWWGCFEVI